MKKQIILGLFFHLALVSLTLGQVANPKAAKKLLAEQIQNADQKQQQKPEQQGILKLSELKQDVYYYGDSVQADDYMRSQCLLDMYLPAGAVLAGKAKETSNALTGRVGVDIKTGNGDDTGLSVTENKLLPVVVWFHGGSLTVGKKEIPERMKNQGIIVVGVGYRLYPKVGAPVYIEDAAAAVAWVFRHIQEFGGDPRRIVVSGHSAGGYLTAMLGLDKKYLAKHGIDANNIAALVPFSGQMITHFTVRKERGIDEKIPLVDDLSPLFHVRGDAPPTLLITGDRELEMLGRYEENAYMERMMKIAGAKDIRLYELDGYGHGMVEPAIPLLLNEIRRLSGN